VTASEIWEGCKKVAHDVVQGAKDLYEGAKKSSSPPVRQSRYLSMESKL